MQIFSDFQHVYNISAKYQLVYNIILKTAVDQTGFFSPLQLHKTFLPPFNLPKNIGDHLNQPS